MHLIDRLTSDTPLICGHRGNMLHSPENTLAGLRSAAAAGAHLCEIDVQTTSDGAYVLMHDQTLDRTTTGSGFVHRTTASEIAGLDAGGWYAPAFAGEGVPTLGAALALARDLGIGLVIEIKERHANDRWLLALAAEIDAAGMADEVIVSSFDHPQLLALKTLVPHLRTLGIVHHRPLDPVALARAARLDGLVVDHPMFHLDDARALHNAGIWAVYAPPPPRVFALAARDKVDLTGDLEVPLQSGVVAFIVCDDVDWLAARVGG